MATTTATEGLDSEGILDAVLALPDQAATAAAAAR